MAEDSDRTVLRLPLSRDRILQAALQLADHEGVAALSMRRLGQLLGVEAMSLYNHIANKDAVLDGLVDLVFTEIGPPPMIADWQEAMRQRATALRLALRRHPWAIGLLESRRQSGPATLAHHEAVLCILRQAGFSLVQTAHAYAVLDSYIYGFVLTEQALPFASGEEVRDLGNSYLQQLQRATYPYLTEFIAEHAMQPDYDYGAEFAFGLDLILAGLTRLR
jgi:AcrR family transcriptional regulator